MNIYQVSRVYWLLSLILFGAFFTDSVQAQQPKQNETDQILKELVGEVRILRQTLHRVNVNAYRSQVLVERIRAQSDRVSRTSRALDDVRAELADMQAGINQFTERVKALEGQIQQEADEKRRTGLETELKEFKYVLDQQRQREQRAREREVRLADQLRQEQAKLDELENRLDLLDREIMNEVEKQEAEDKNREKKRPQ